MWWKVSELVAGSILHSPADRDGFLIISQVEIDYIVYTIKIGQCAVVYETPDYFVLVDRIN